MPTLSDFADPGTKTTKKDALWTPPDDRVPGTDTTALVLDQTLSKTGWSVLKVLAGRAMVWATGVIEDPGQEGTGFADDYARGRRMFLAYLGLIEMYAPLLLLHEMPSTGIKGRTTSSLLAGMAAENAAENVGLPVAMFQNQHVKKVMTNDGRATKAQVKAAVLRVWPDLATRGLRINQDVTDSIAGGLVWMKENR